MIKKNLVKLYNKTYDLIDIILSFINKKLLVRLYRILPLKNYIVLECESDMDDNPRALYEYWIRNELNKKYKIIWLVQNVKRCKELYSNKNVIFINRFNFKPMNSIRLDYYLGLSKYFIFSHPYWFKKRKDKQCIININHTSLCVKKSSGQVNNSFDKVLTVTDFDISYTAKWWKCDSSKVIACGWPRNDFLFVSLKKKKQILEELRVNASNKLIICMPTYKKSENQIDGDYIDPFCLSVVTTENDLIQLNSYLKKCNIEVLIKPHPLQIKREIKILKLSNIKYIFNDDLLNNNTILYELLGCADALLTDFSSVCFDFMVKDKPIGFFLNNFDNYTRGYNIDNPIEFMAGEKIYNYNDLISFVNNVSNENDMFREQRNKLNILINGNYGNNNCESVSNYIFNKLTV